MGERRLPPLEELGLRDYTPVEAVLYADRNSPPTEKRKLQGRLVGGVIELADSQGVPERRVDPRGFVAAAGYSRKAKPYNYICIPGQGGVTLAALARGDDNNEAQRIAGLLKDTYAVETLAELRNYVEVRCRSRDALRDWAADRRSRCCRRAAAPAPALICLAHDPHHLRIS